MSFYGFAKCIPFSLNMQFIQCAQAAHPWCVLTLLFSNRILNELPSSYFSEIFSSSALSELYVSMRDPESGIKELKLEKEKKLYNHCFSGITQYIQLNSILFIYCSVKTIKLSQGALQTLMHLGQSVKYHSRSSLVMICCTSRT